MNTKILDLKKINKRIFLYASWFLIFIFYYLRIKIQDIPIDYILSPLFILILATNSPQKKIVFNYSLPFYFLSLIFYFISIIQGRSPFSLSSLDFPVKILIWSSLLSVSINYISSYKNLLSFIKVLIWANLTSLLITLYSFIIYKPTIIRFYYIFLERKSLNANYVGLNLEICIVFIFLIFTLEKIIFKKNNFENKYITLILIFYFFTIWTLSRTAIFASIFLLIFILIKKFFKNNFILKIRSIYDKSKLFLIGFIGTGLTTLFLNYKDSLFVLSLLLFRISSGYSHGGGRDIYWEKSIEGFLKNPFFGSGSYGIRYTSELEGAMLHNSFLEILIGYGIVGVISIAICLWLFTKMLKIEYFPQPILSSTSNIAFIFIIWSLTLNLETERSLWFFFTVLASISRICSLKRFS